MPKKNEIPPPKCGTAIHENVEIGAEKMSVILKADIKRKLKEIGIESGDNVIVHTSLKSMGYVCGGAQAVIEALIETVGENGTIMMPTQSWKNLDPETGVHGEVDEKDWPLIRENWPAYDKKRRRPTRWTRWRRCFDSGRGAFAAIIRRAPSAHGERTRHI